jgi:hypothetical protein
MHSLLSFEQAALFWRPGSGGSDPVAQAAHLGRSGTGGPDPVAQAAQLWRPCPCGPGATVDNILFIVVVIAEENTYTVFYFELLYTYKLYFLLNSSLQYVNNNN